MSVIVVVSVVPTREANAALLLDDLQQQTHPPDDIWYLMSGSSSWSILSTRRAIKQDVSVTLRPAGYRWQQIDTLSRTASPDDVVVVLDDDVRVSPTFIAQSLSTMESAPDTGVVAWFGHPRLKKYLPIGAPRRTASPLVIAGIGASMTRLAPLAGITTHPLAQECFGPAGDDELLVSLWMRERGWQLLLPAGVSPVRSVDALQFAPTASSVQHGKRWEERRRSIRKEYGWI